MCLKERESEREREREVEKESRKRDKERETQLKTVENSRKIEIVCLKENRERER